jgi:hypothetical protein
VICPIEPLTGKIEADSLLSNREAHHVCANLNSALIACEIELLASLRRGHDSAIPPDVFVPDAGTDKNPTDSTRNLCQDSSVGIVLAVLPELRGQAYSGFGKITVKQV